MLSGEAKNLDLERQFTEFPCSGRDEMQEGQMEVGREEGKEGERDRWTGGRYGKIKEEK